MPMIIVAIIYISIFIIFTYCAGIVLAWSYGIRLGKIFKEKQEKIRQLEKARISMALSCVKKYKIAEDYRKEVLRLERNRRFIMEKMLLSPAPKFSLRKKDAIFLR
jgi:hypothetical protein